VLLEWPNRRCAENVCQQICHLTETSPVRVRVREGQS
jgi:hypothetical protein